MVIQIGYHHFTKNVSPWLPIILVILSNDIELHPGPHLQKCFFSFMNWNLNSLVKNKVERVDLIDKHNSIFNYDLISICETSLNHSVDIPDPLLKEYKFIPANHPQNESHGGVGRYKIKHHFQLFPGKIWLLMNVL